MPDLLKNLVVELLVIRKATPNNVKAIVKFIDSTFTKEGYGFVTSAQINTETKRGAVYIAADNNNIIGVRVGIKRVYNLAVHPDYRKNGIGRKLIEIEPPETIRVKSQPIGHLSKAQLASFKNPEGFYDSVGYEYDHNDYPRNFWQKGKDKAHFHKQGKVAHIKVYQKKGSPTQLPLEPEHFQ